MVGVEAVAGIDRWRGGWIIARSDGDGLTLLHADNVEVAEPLLEGCAAIAVDMPLALPVEGTRDAEIELRSRLGSAGRSVFISPTRAAIVAPDQANATRINRAHGGPGISAQSWGLAGSVRELRNHLRGSPAQSRWFETHPESAFAEMNGGTPLASKRSALGAAQRLPLLRSRIPALDDLLLMSPPKVPFDDVLDALAAWWSALRIVQGDAVLIGGSDVDDQGFPLGIRI